MRKQQKAKPPRVPASKKADPIDVYVGEQIRRFRLTTGQSQTKIAETLGLTFQQVQKYEKGANRIAPSRLAKLAEFLGVSVSEFFPQKYVNGGDGIGDDDPIRKLAQTRNGMKLARAYVQIGNSDAQDAIVGMVEAFVKA